MYGAIVGDILGSSFEFCPNGTKPQRFTDDTVLTVAVGEVMLDAKLNNKTDDDIRKELIRKFKEYGRKYPNAGYGETFINWLENEESNPYNSYGDGSAMRVSSVGWLFDDINKVRNMARLSAEVTHNHPEGIKGAEAVASAIYLARTGHDKKYIKNFIESEFEYDLSIPSNEYDWDITCQVVVPQSITIFLEADSYEDTIDKSVEVGGDTATIAAIAGSIAEVYYSDISKKLWRISSLFLPYEFMKILKEIRENSTSFNGKDGKSYEKIY